MVGGAIALLLFTFSRDSPKKFKAEHVLVLGLNSFVGPDYTKFFSPFYGPGYWESTFYQSLNGFTHTIIGWLIAAFLFAGIYFLLFRYLGEGKKSQVSPISYLHTYMLIVAGGLNHFGLDMLDSSVRIFPNVIGNDTRLGLSSFYTGEKMAEGILWESFSWFDDKYLLILGLFFLVGLMWLLKNKDVKWAWIGGAIFGIIVYGSIWLIGGNIVSNENDLGLLVYVSIAWLIPLFLCVFAMESDHEKVAIN